jgi:hypothetical protein
MFGGPNFAFDAQDLACGRVYRMLQKPKSRDFSTLKPLVRLLQYRGSTRDLVKIFRPRLRPRNNFETTFYRGRNNRETSALYKYRNLHREAGRRLAAVH